MAIYDLICSELTNKVLKQPKEDGWPKRLGELTARVMLLGTPTLEPGTKSQGWVANTKNTNIVLKGSCLTFSSPQHDTDTLRVIDKQGKEIGYFESFSAEMLVPLLRRRIIAVTGCVLSNWRSNELEVIVRVYLR